MVKRRNAAEIQSMRGIFEAPCRYGCGTGIVVTSTIKGKTVVLDEQDNGYFVINTSDQAVWVGEGGDYGLHVCPELQEVY